MTSIEKLNKHAVKYVNKYQNLKFGTKKVNTPYFKNIFSKKVPTKVSLIINSKTIGYGVGKGKLKPQEIVKLTYKAAKTDKMYIKKSSELKIQNLMKLFGLGVDCSGYLFNILKYSIEKTGKYNKFLRNSRFKIGVKEFDMLSEKVETPQPLDILISSDKSHIKLLIFKNNELFETESSLSLGEVSVQKYIPQNDFILKRLRFLV